MNDLHQFLRTRRSIRKFKSQPVPKPILQRIMETAIYAPSARNNQPWHFFILTSSGAKGRLAEEMAREYQVDLSESGLTEGEMTARLERTRKRILEAPVVVIVCLNSHSIDRQPDPKRQSIEKMLAIQSVASAILQLLLAVHAEGLGAVWTCGPLFTSSAVRIALKLPDEYEPQAMLIAGFPAESPQPPQRKGVNEVISFR